MRERESQTSEIGKVTLKHDVQPHTAAPRLHWLPRMKGTLSNRGVFLYSVYVINTLNIISIPWPTAAVQRKFRIVARCPGPGAYSWALPVLPGAHWRQEGTTLCNSGEKLCQCVPRILSLCCFYDSLFFPPFLLVNNYFLFLVFSIVDAKVSNGIVMPPSWQCCYCCYSYLVSPPCRTAVFVVATGPLPPRTLDSGSSVQSKALAWQQLRLADNLRPWRNLTVRTLN